MGFLAEMGGSLWIVGAVALGLTGYTGFLVLTFLIHFYDARTRANGRPRSATRYARAILAEWWYGLAYALAATVGWLPPWDRTPDPDNPGAPVLLVHGYMVNRGCLFALYWRLRRYGYRNLYTANLHPGGGPISEMAHGLNARILALTERHGGARVSLVCHSLGGVVVRQCLALEPDLPLDRVITLGSPHHGTTLAHLSSTKIARALRPGSDFLASLDPEPPAHFVTIYSELDNMVIPARSAAWGPQSIGFVEIGHMSLLFSPFVFEVILQHLPPATRPVSTPSPDPNRQK